jgi:hypothetical protein
MPELAEILVKPGWNTRTGQEWQGAKLAKGTKP